MKRLVFIVVVLGLVSQLAMLAQQDSDSGGALNISATTHDSIREWDTTINRMVQSRELVARVFLADPILQDRQHETLVQYYQGVRVYGGSLSRQTSRGVTVSILGTLLTGIALNPVPGLSPVQALTMIQNVSGGTLAGTDSPELIIFRTLIGTYALSYRATMSDAKTYYVDASSGAVLWTVDEIKTQRAVGIGTGALGDRKKIATKQAAGAFRTHDELRPASIRTYDTRGSQAAFVRIDSQYAPFDSDFSTDLDNTWTHSAVVDAHVHTGWTLDYLYKQQNWKGVDNQNSDIVNVVHSGYFGAHFRPIFTSGQGVFAYGVTNPGSAGSASFTSVDVVAHEVMHGVTSAALRQRTGDGIGGLRYYHPLGPTSATYNGVSYACDTTTFGGFPAYCAAGRYRTASNHPGAINEAFADVIGTATEFYFHEAGPGLLQGDYKNGEDVIGASIRRLDVPQADSVYGLPRPDHYTRTFSYVVVILAGTRAAPTAVGITSWVISDGKLFSVPLDGGGVHFNLTVLGHAFYLAIEGGQNATSGRTVQGVGFANKRQIERAFFRAMTMLMPNEPTMFVAANATVQAAIDLYGENSAAAQATHQAMQAVGLR